MSNRRFSGTDTGLGLGGGLLFVALILFLLWLVPSICIFALNGLFDLNIEHNLANFGYFWLLYLTLGGSILSRRK